MRKKKHVSQGNFKLLLGISGQVSSSFLDPKGSITFVLWVCIFRRHPAFKTGDFFTAIGTEIWETNRRIRSHILSDTGSVSHLTIQLVLIDTIRGSGFADLARSTGKHELVGVAVFFRIKQVGTTAS